MFCHSQRSKIPFNEIIKKRDDTSLFFPALLILAIPFVPLPTSSLFHQGTQPWWGSGPNTVAKGLIKVSDLRNSNEPKHILVQDQRHESFPCPWLMCSCHSHSTKAPHSHNDSLGTQVQNHHWKASFDCISSTPSSQGGRYTKAFHWRQYAPGWKAPRNRQSPTQNHP